MSYDYTLNYPNYDYMSYGGYGPYDYSGSFTLNGNYPQPINNQASIFNANGALTLPATQTTNAPTTEQIVNPDVATAETSVPAIDGAVEEKPSALEELQMEMLMTGAFMGAPMVLPKALSPVQTANALKETSAMIDKGARGAKMADAAKTSKAFGDILNSYRLEESIKSVNRPQWQTDEILAKLKDLRTQYNEALKAKDATKMAKVAAEMDVLVKEAKMPNWFARTWGKIRCFFKKEPIKAPQSLSAITPKMAKAGQQAAQTAQAAEAAKNAASTSKLTKASNWIKDANKSGGFKAMAIFEGFVEGITEVIPAFWNGGAEEGVKQTAKSAANVAASATGWCVGAKAGAWAGAAIGSFICPGVGTAIGGAIGSIVGGVLGSWGAKKAMKCVTGESYSEKQEKIKNQQANEKAQAEAAAQAVAKEGTTSQTTQATTNATAQTQGQQQAQATTNNLTYDMWLQYFNGSLTGQSKAIADAKWQELMANARMTTMNNIDYSNPFAMPC